MHAKLHVAKPKVRSVWVIEVTGSEGLPKEPVPVQRLVLWPTDRKLLSLVSSSTKLTMLGPLTSYLTQSYSLIPSLNCKRLWIKKAPVNLIQLNKSLHGLDPA